MSHHTLSIAPGVMIERVGADVVVMVPGSTEVIKLSGDAAHTIRNIQAGDTPVLPSQIVSDLVDRGIVISQAGMSRRGLITAGALGAGAGVVMLSMPAAAAAGSGPEMGNGSGGGDNSSNSCTTGTCGPGTESGFSFLTYYLDSGKWVFFAERSTYEDTVVSSLTFYVDGCEYSARNLSQNPTQNQSKWEIFWDIDQSDVEVLVSGSNTPAICGNFTTSVPGNPSQDKIYKATFPFEAVG